MRQPDITSNSIPISLRANLAKSMGNLGREDTKVNSTTDTSNHGTISTAHVGTKPQGPLTLLAGTFTPLYDYDVIFRPNEPVGQRHGGSTGPGF
jgi:hypothetical protein